jgi:hypothetical protein
LTLYYQNVRGLRTKIYDLYTASLFVDHGCICLTETWTNNTIFNSELFCDDFIVYRCDRSPKTSDKNDGGGVLIAVNKQFSSLEVILENSSIEMVCVKISLNGKWTYIFNVYIPPDATVEKYNVCIENLETLLANVDPDDQFLIMGDFNLPDIKWKNYIDENYNFMAPSDMSSDKSKHFIDKISSLPFVQVNDIRNNLDRILDLIFTDIPNDLIFINCDDPLLKIDIYHPPLQFSLNVPDVNDLSSSQTVCRYNFKQCDFDNMNAFFERVDWTQVTSCNEMEYAVEAFYSILRDAISRFVPCTKIKERKKAPWITPNLKRLKNRKNSLHKKLKKNDDNAIRTEYNLVKRQLVVETKLAYTEYISDLKETLKTDPKKFWGYINRKRNNDLYPKIMSYKDETKDNDKDICKLFAKFFESVYKNDNSMSFPDLNILPINTTGNFQPPMIRNCDIFTAIAEVKCSYSPGPDNVPACILTKCINPLVDVLSYLFNLSLRTSVFPELWKSSFIAPLFKKGARNDICNYRGIAKLSPIPKLFESIVTTDMTFKAKSFISPRQHGFCSGRSTLTNLLTLSTHVSSGFANKMQVDVGYFDFSKAFDQLNHRILLLKLSCYGFSTSYVNWIMDYLTGRTQSVTFNGHLSENISVSSGVPQGSHLGPFLFVLFINDLPAVIQNSQILLFADDAKIYKTVNSTLDCDDLQIDFDNLSTWCNNNDLAINIKKCNILTFCRKRFVIIYNYMLCDSGLDRVSEFCDLGVTFDSKMCFNKHVNIVKARASSRLGMIKRWSKEFNDPHVTKSLYVSLVRSILEYNSSLWCPFYNSYIASLESVQRQFSLFALRRIYWNNDAPSYEVRLLLLELNKLEDRRVIQNVVFIFKLLNGQLDCENILSLITVKCPLRNLRTNNFLKTNIYNRNYLANEPLSLICNNFNDLYMFFDFNLNLSSFKKILYLYFRNKMPVTV